MPQSTSRRSRLALYNFQKLWQSKFDQMTLNEKGVTNIIIPFIPVTFNFGFILLPSTTLDIVNKSHLLSRKLNFV